MVVRELHVFPVKGLAGIASERVVVEHWGFEHDRRWMLVDADGRFLTQRVLPRMATIRTALVPGGLSLRLPGSGGVDVAIPPPDAPPITVTVWRSTLVAMLADGYAHAWLSAVLGQDCRLVHMHDPAAARPVNPAYACPGETVSFADGYPVLLTSLNSLADVNVRLARPVPIGRFRGNLVVDGAAPWAEDGWRRLRVGGATFRVAHACSRCTVTTIDQATGTRPDRLEPLRTLGTFRQDEHGIMFGQNLIPETLGGIAVGDPVEVLEAGPPNVQTVS